VPTPLSWDFISFGESGWSNTQTYTVGDWQIIASPSPTSTPEPTSTPYTEPQQLEQELILGATITLAVIVAGLGLLVYLIKRK
jgi:predicted cobalt transporter CbtA